MRLADYKLIVKFIDEHSSNCGRTVLCDVIAKFGVDNPHDTLLSVFLNHSQRKVKASYSGKTRAENAKLYYDKYKEKVAEMIKTGKSSHFLVGLSTKFDLSPGLMARLIIEQFLKEQSMLDKVQTVNYKGSNSVDVNGGFSALTLETRKNTKAGALVAQSCNGHAGQERKTGYRESSVMSNEKVTSIAPTKNTISMWIKDPYLITDDVLKEQVLQCMSYDVCYGPINDAIRHSVGLEFEEKLKDCVQGLDLPFLDENDLRKRGYDKTPDVKLEVPVAVDGQPVCWIESKASFGDLETHNEYLQGQYYSYWNRFGPGLVIYWFGFIDEISDEMEKQGILIMDGFPSTNDITFMNP